MPTFFLFAGSNYYPAGGVYDLKEDFQADNAFEAITEAHRLAHGEDWFHLCDSRLEFVLSLDNGKLVRGPSYPSAQDARPAADASGSDDQSQPDDQAQSDT